MNPESKAVLPKDKAEMEAVTPMILPWWLASTALENRVTKTENPVAKLMAAGITAIHGIQEKGMLTVRKMDNVILMREMNVSWFNENLNESFLSQ